MLSHANTTDSVSQLTNQLKLNEPQIKLMDDFKQQIETMRLAQGIWYLSNLARPSRGLC